MSKDRPQCSLLLENREGKVLLQLRDDIDIPYPNCWGTFGGEIEEGETPAAAMIRETWEELRYKLEDPEYIGPFPFNGYVVHAFRKRDRVSLDDLDVQEGQRGMFFDPDEIPNIDCAFNTQEIIEEVYL